MDLWRHLSKIQTGILLLIALVFIFLAFGELTFIFLFEKIYCQKLSNSCLSEKLLVFEGAEEANHGQADEGMKKRQGAFTSLHSCVMQKDKPLLIIQKIASECRK